eukprot:SAG11_NODE_12448_length_703_cov_0.678808_1_plen_66_part_00
MCPTNVTKELRRLSSDEAVAELIFAAEAQRLLKKAGGDVARAVHLYNAHERCAVDMVAVTGASLT